MSTRTTVVLAALAVVAVHHLDETWLQGSNGDAIGARAGATLLALSFTSLAALAWVRLPRLRAAFAFGGLIAVSGAWSGLIGADAGGTAITGLPYLAAANAVLAVGLAELVALVGTRLQPHAARA
jgi:hypothetical protein